MCHGFLGAEFLKGVGMNRNRAGIRRAGGRVPHRFGVEPEKGRFPVDGFRSSPHAWR